MSVDRTMISRWGVRLAGIAIGFLFLFWVPLEDTDVVYAQLLGAGLAAWGAMWHLSGKAEVNGLVVWGAAGLLTTPLILLLMSFKSGLHQHGFPDFSPMQAARVVAQTPYWTLGGLAIGGLWTRVRRRHDDSY